MGLIQLTDKASPVCPVQTKLFFPHAVIVSGHSFFELVTYAISSALFFECFPAL
jgi:hypothetical protein